MRKKKQRVYIDLNALREWDIAMNSFLWRGEVDTSDIDTHLWVETNEIGFFNACYFGIPYKIVEN